jgi:N-carbamoylputrescine amidase
LSGKSHIPDGTGYQEKFYFTPGDTGFKVFHTKVGCIGIAICWDQWFPEAARAMALLGADILLYPTAIGSEPQDETLHSRRQWQRVMQGHAAANVSSLIKDVSH